MGSIPSDELLVDQVREGFEVPRVGFVVSNEPVERILIAAPIALPETHGFPTVEVSKVLRSSNVQLAFDVFESALKAESSGGKAQIKVRQVDAESRKLCLQVGHVEDAAEKRDQQIRLIEGILKAFLRE